MTEPTIAELADRAESLATILKSLSETDRPKLRLAGSGDSDDCGRAVRAIWESLGEWKKIRTPVTPLFLDRYPIIRNARFRPKETL